jgi:hypothetical protein
MKTILSYQNFIAEKYVKYSDYKGKPFGTPDEMKKDVVLSLRHGIPLPWEKTESFISSIEDQSVEDKGIKFEIVLKSGDVIHAFKSGLMRSEWDWFINSKRSNINSIFDLLLDKIHSPLEKWKYLYDKFDSAYYYSDSAASRKSGEKSKQKLDAAYKDLSGSEKKKADDYQEKNPR